MTTRRGSEKPSAFDPESFVPRTLPARPRMLLDDAQLQRVRDQIKAHAWMATCRDELLRLAQTPPSQETPPDPSNTKINGEILRHALRNALAHRLAGEGSFRDRAVATFRGFCKAYLGWPPSTGDARAGGGSLGESRVNLQMGWVYDLLEAAGISDADRDLYRGALQLALAVSDHNAHRTCGNHNTWCLAGQSSLATALGDVQRLRGILLGRPCPPRPDSFDTPTFRYGLLHMLSHDFLADGLHWERTPGYHFYTLMGLCESLEIFARLGVDLWHARVPAAMESSGNDLHRGYGPAGLKEIKAAFDAPFYSAFANLDFSMLHDSGLANLRGAYIWGPLYAFAWQEFRDPKYAWLLHRIEREYGPKREVPGLPMILQTGNREFDFLRLRDPVPPAGEFSFTPEATVGLAGRHLRGSTLLTGAGAAVLRSDAADPSAPGAYLFYGPHSAGHQSPAALHLDLHAAGSPVTSAPMAHGYNDPVYPTWVRTTIAHNTVSVDRKPMFPYDLGGDSIWEADSWRAIRSEGALELFQPEADFAAVRAANQVVYPGIRLDRTVVLTRRYALDVYRALADEPHVFDWAMHVVGNRRAGAETPTGELGSQGGYAMLRDAALLGGEESDRQLAWDRPGAVTRACVRLVGDAKAYVAQDPPAGEAGLGGLGEQPPRSSLIVRATGREALFVSLWWFDDAAGLSLGSIRGDARRDLAIDVLEPAGKGSTGAAVRWEIPMQTRSVRRAAADAQS